MRYRKRVVEGREPNTIVCPIDTYTIFIPRGRRSWLLYLGLIYKHGLMYSMLPYYLEMDLIPEDLPPTPLMLTGCVQDPPPSELTTYLRPYGVRISRNRNGYSIFVIVVSINTRIIY